MADLTHASSRDVDQRPEVVHIRLLELADRLRREAPPIEPGTQAATLLGVNGPLGIEIGDGGPARIEVWTTRGRVRGEARADVLPLDAGTRTRLSLAVAIRPQGFAANLMLGAALATMPLERQVIDGLERGLDDLVIELAKPDAEWVATAWQPPGIPISS